MNPEIQKRLGTFAAYPQDMQLQIISLVQKMISLGFDASFSHAEEGPVVRTYYFTPSPTSQLSRIFGKEDDLALSLSCESIILSRSLGTMAIAVPRVDRQTIKFDSLLLKLFSHEKTRNMVLPILLGNTPQGNELFLDLAGQPHLLIAGTTGSGKSIFTSQVICSLALVKSPSDLKFILVDTKQLDLTLFSGLPHIGDVITDIHALRAKLTELLDCVTERTSLMSGLCRNINDWNRFSPEQKFDYKILVIDEFADIIGKDLEYLKTLKPSFRPPAISDLVQRLAQVSRAVGIHLIVATQRPSVKVLGGDAKTNFPARIAFKLPTMQDSRVVLDENGAERLLGKGDFLYKTATSEVMQRAHSAFVTINDIATIIAQSDFLRRQYAKN